MDMDKLLRPESLHLYSGLLLGTIAFCVPFVANLAQVVATWHRDWRAQADQAKAEGGLVRSFHIAATVCSAIFGVRWLTQGYMGLSGLPSMLEYMASDIALSIVELWVTYAAYYSLRMAFLISGNTHFPDTCLWYVVQVQIMQLIVCDSTCYILGSISNKAIFFIFKDAAHLVNFVGNLLVIVGASCHLTRQLRKKEPLLLSENKIGTFAHLNEKLSTHLRVIWIITVGTILGIGFYVFFLVNRDYDGPFIDEKVNDNTVYVTIGINVVELLCLVLASSFYWIPFDACQGPLRFLSSNAASQPSLN